MCFTHDIACCFSLAGLPVSQRDGHAIAAAVRRPSQKALPAGRQGGVQRLAAPELLPGPNPPHPGQTRGIGKPIWYKIKTTTTRGLDSILDVCHTDPESAPRSHLSLRFLPSKASKVCHHGRRSVELTDVLSVVFVCFDLFRHFVQNPSLWPTSASSLGQQATLTSPASSKDALLIANFGLHYTLLDYSVIYRPGPAF